MANFAHFCVHGAPVLNIKGATLGIFGKGAIGTEVATLAQALGMKVLFGEHRGAKVVRPGYVSFEDLLAQSDIITLHCPLTADTRGLIGAKELSQMKPGAMLINTARGPLIDETAVGDALLSGHLGGVARCPCKRTTCGRTSSVANAFAQPHHYPPHHLGQRGRDVSLNSRHPRQSQCLRTR